MKKQDEVLFVWHDTLMLGINYMTIIVIVKLAVVLIVCTEWPAQIISHSVRVKGLNLLKV